MLWPSSCTVLALMFSIITAFMVHRKTETYRLRFLLQLESLDIPSTRPHKLTYTTQLSQNLSYSTPTLPPDGAPDTTAVVLNWSRLENVLLISTLLCSAQLRDTIYRVLIWNNSPKPLTMETFSHTGCNLQNLKIYNSPLNIYFQARFIACAQAETPYCFIQDDDYLVRPEIIKTMRSFAHRYPLVPSVHLLPPHEHLLSRLRTITDLEGNVSTSFAWLGHGTLARRDTVREFLQLLKHLDLAEDEMRMADNFFTILANRHAEQWFDHSIELGGGQPFTVGSEGDDRNDKYMTRALDHLIGLAKAECSNRAAFYVNMPVAGLNSIINRSPCLKGRCLIESNINLLPAHEHLRISRAKEMAALVRKAYNALKEETITTYINNSLSNAVDNDPATSFHSPGEAKKGEWITLAMLYGTPQSDADIELAFLVSLKTAYILQRSQLSIQSGEDWIEVASDIRCYEVELRLGDSENDTALQECAFMPFTTCSSRRMGVQSFRVTLSEDIEYPWVIYEVWLRVLRNLD